MTSCNILLLFLLMFSLIENGASKWWKPKHRGKRGCLFGPVPGPDKECQYSLTPKYSECDDESQTYTKSYHLVNGPEGCALGYVIVKMCIESQESAPCKYVNDPHERWSYCDRSTYTKTRAMILVSGGDHCPTVSYKSKPCRKHKDYFFLG